jgi:hypothetical protein
MTLISAGFKYIVEGMISNLRTTKDPVQTVGTVRANVKLLGQQHQESKVGDFTLICDEPVESGGTNRDQLR